MLIVWYDGEGAWIDFGEGMAGEIAKNIDPKGIWQ